MLSKTQTSAGTECPLALQEPGRLEDKALRLLGCLQMSICQMTDGLASRQPRAQGMAVRLDSLSAMYHCAFHCGQQRVITLGLRRCCCGPLFAVHVRLDAAEPTVQGCSFPGQLWQVSLSTRWIWKSAIPRLLTRLTESSSSW